MYNKRKIIFYIKTTEKLLQLIYKSILNEQNGTVIGPEIKNVEM